MASPGPVSRKRLIGIEVMMFLQISHRHGPIVPCGPCTKEDDERQRKRRATMRPWDNPYLETEALRPDSIILWVQGSFFSADSEAQ